MGNLVDFSDFYFVSWDQYQAVVDDLTQKIKTYLYDNDISFDFIVPILRGGGVLSISLSHSLGVLPFFPAQYKYLRNDDTEGAYKPIKLLCSLDALKNKSKEYNILVTEGNHCSGQTAQMCINDIITIIPKAKIYYASITRDYSYTNQMNNTIYEWWGILTNESKKLNQTQCDNLSIVNKYTIFPWENAEEEIQEVNDSYSNY